jgi:hypothetical protein
MRWHEMEKLFRRRGFWGFRSVEVLKMEMVVMFRVHPNENEYTERVVVRYRETQAKTRAYRVERQASKAIYDLKSYLTEHGHPTPGQQRGCFDTTNSIHESR